MRELFSLDSRLALCASFVSDGARLADIGTDHAYLPVHLVLEGRISYAIAADIAPEPLKKGHETVVKYRVEDRVETRLSPGLEKISPEEADHISIAGMGGDTIIGILEASPWVKDGKHTLILQPMTKVHRVVKYLYENGFEIVAQDACVAGGKLYTAMKVSYTGNCINVPPEFTYTGILTPETNPMHRRYLEHQIAVLGKRAKGDGKYKVIADKIAERL
ncbi:MAG: class I SAM-dependent methyltransferase [Eubacteriales bacterium]|nr:class I SAM-dependent methyltransferase [Eubacteriales bacterium]